jgi:hypothetical protein
MELKYRVIGSKSSHRSHFKAGKDTAEVDGIEASDEGGIIRFADHFG